MEKEVYLVKDLEDALSGTVTRKYVPAFEKQISNNIKSLKENNFILQNIEVLAFSKSPKERISGLKQDLLDLYHSRFSNDYSFTIPESLKVVQAMMMDTLVFGYNLTTGSIALYTMNIKALFKLGVDTPKLLQSCFDNNNVGNVHAFRIDMEYDSYDRFIYKAVKLISNKKLNIHDYCYFPYDYVYAAMKMMNKWLDKGITFKVVQTIDGLIKERFISCNTRVLESYCDNPKAVSGIKVVYYPMKGYMYAPVLGAPSLSAMVTKVSLFDTDTVSPVVSVHDITVKRPSDPIKLLIYKNAVLNTLREAYDSDKWAYLDKLEQIPRLRNFFKNEEDAFSFDVRYLSKILDSLSEDELKVLFTDIEAESYGSVMTDLITKNEVLDVDKIHEMSDSDIRQLLKTGIYFVASIGSKCKYYSMIVTNNKEYLAKVYGLAYFGRCESFNVRFNEMKYLLNRSCDTDEDISRILTYCGFPVDAEMIKAAKNIKLESAVSGKSESNIGAEYRDIFRDTSNIAYDKTESSTDSILCRSCFNPIAADGTVLDYYRYFVKGRVVKMIRLK